MLFDSHLHTEVSADSEMKARDALAAAEAQGIGLVFTEHIDFSYQGKLDFIFSPEEYWEMYEPLRGERLSLGVELGMVPGEIVTTDAGHAAETAKNSSIRSISSPTGVQSKSIRAAALNAATHSD